MFNFNCISLSISKVIVTTLVLKSRICQFTKWQIRFFNNIHYIPQLFPDYFTHGSLLLSSVDQFTRTWQCPYSEILKQLIHRIFTSASNFTNESLYFYTFADWCRHTPSGMWQRGSTSTPAADPRWRLGIDYSSHGVVRPLNLFSPDASL